MTKEEDEELLEKIKELIALDKDIQERLEKLEKSMGIRKKEQEKHVGKYIS